MRALRIHGPDMLRAMCAAVKAANDCEDAPITVSLNGMDGFVLVTSPDGSVTSSTSFSFEHVPGEMPIRGAWQLTAAELRDVLRHGDSVSPRDQLVTWDPEHPDTLAFERDDVARSSRSTVTGPRLPLAVAPAMPERFQDVLVHPKQWLQASEFAGEQGWVRLDPRRSTMYAVQPSGAVLMVRLEQTAFGHEAKEQAAADVRDDQPVPFGQGQDANAAGIEKHGAIDMGADQTLLFGDEPELSAAAAGRAAAAEMPDDLALLYGHEREARAAAMARHAAVDMRGDQALAIGYALAVEWSERKADLKKEIKKRRLAGESIPNQEADKIYEACMPRAQLGRAAPFREDGVSLNLFEDDAGPGREHLTVRAGALTLRVPPPEASEGMRAALVAADPQVQGKAKRELVPVARQQFLEAIGWALEGERLARAAMGSEEEGLIVLAEDGQGGPALLEVYRPWPSDEKTDRVKQHTLGRAQVVPAMVSARALQRALDHSPAAKEVLVGGSSVGGFRLVQGGMSVVLPPARAGATMAQRARCAWLRDPTRSIDYEIRQSRDSEIEELMAEDIARGPESAPLDQQARPRAPLSETAAETRLFQRHVRDLRDQGWFEYRIGKEEMPVLLERAQAGDAAAMERLNLGHTALIYAMIHERSNDMPLPRRYAIAREALTEAILKWRPDGGAGLNHLTRRIYISRLADAVTLDGNYQLSFTETQTLMRLSRIQQRLTQQLARAPTVHEIAGEMGFDTSSPESERSALRKLDALLRLAASRKAISLSDMDEEELEPEAYLPAPAPSPVRRSPSSQQERLAEMIDGLPASSAHAATHQYGLGNRLQLSPAEYAMYIGMTQETAHERRAEAEAAIRKSMTGFRRGP
jgi:hypothetical protein